MLSRCLIEKNPRRQIRQDDELLLEAHQLDLKDDPAPPGTLGAELRLHLGIWITPNKPVEGLIAALVAKNLLLEVNTWTFGNWGKKRTKIHMSAIDLVIWEKMSMSQPVQN